MFSRCVLTGYEDFMEVFGVIMADNVQMRGGVVVVVMAIACVYAEDPHAAGDEPGQVEPEE